MFKWANDTIVIFALSVIPGSALVGNDSLPVYDRSGHILCSHYVYFYLGLSHDEQNRKLTSGWVIQKLELQIAYQILSVLQRSGEAVSRHQISNIQENHKSPFFLSTCVSRSCLPFQAGDDRSERERERENDWTNIAPSYPESSERPSSTSFGNEPKETVARTSALHATHDTTDPSSVVGVLACMLPARAPEEGVHCPQSPRRQCDALSTRSWRRRRQRGWRERRWD